MECNDARPLIPSYLDGELTQAQAGPLRKHLLDCQPCRASAQDVKSLKRWFVEDEPMQIPRDFAARVARRAFAGDRGAAVSLRDRDQRWSEPALGSSTPALRSSSDDRNLRFVLMVTSIAAVLLIFLSMAIRSLSLPSSDKLLADDPKYVTREMAIEELDRLNQAEMKPIAPDKSASASGPASGGTGSTPGGKPAAVEPESAKK